eukprot:1612075-Prymnesium_polylepis.1
MAVRGVGGRPAPHRALVEQLGLVVALECRRVVGLNPACRVRFEGGGAASGLRGLALSGTRGLARPLALQHRRHARPGASGGVTAQPSPPPHAHNGPTPPRLRAAEATVAERHGGRATHRCGG